MKPPDLLPILLLLLACQAETPPALSPVEALCSEKETIDYADFYWDNLRSTDPELFHRALSICSRHCPESNACAPVLSVALWYERTTTPPTEPPATVQEGRQQ